MFLLLCGTLVCRPQEGMVDNISNFISITYNVYMSGSGVMLYDLYILYTHL